MSLGITAHGGRCLTKQQGSDKTDLASLVTRNHERDSATTFSETSDSFQLAPLPASKQTLGHIDNVPILDIKYARRPAPHGRA